MTQRDRRPPFDRGLHRSRTTGITMLLVALALTACSTFSSFDPTPIDEVPFRERSITKSRT